MIKKRFLAALIRYIEANLVLRQVDQRRVKFLDLKRNNGEVSS